MNRSEPVAILYPKKKVFIAGLVMLIVLYLFFVFGVILPVLKSGDYASVWPESDKRIGAKAVLFYMAWLFLIILPSMIPILRRGVTAFYDDRIEIEPFLARKKIVIPYENMVVTVHGDYRMVLYECNSECRNSIFSKLKSRYFRGIGYVLLPRGNENPESIPTLIDMLEQKVVDFERKVLS